MRLRRRQMADAALHFFIAHRSNYLGLETGAEDQRAVLVVQSDGSDFEQIDAATDRRRFPFGFEKNVHVPSSIASNGFHRIAVYGEG